MQKFTGGLKAVLLSSSALVSLNASAADCAQELNQWPYADSFGNEQAQVMIDASLELFRDCKDVKLTALATAGADAFGLEADLLDSKAQLSLLERSKFSVDAGATVLGYTLDSFNYQAKLGQTWSDKLAFPIDTSVDEVIMVGPIPLGVEVGLQGEVALDYALGVAALEAELTATPSVDTDMYVLADVDVAAAAVGVTGKAKLLDDVMPTSLTLSLDPVALNELSVSVVAQNELKALDGSLSVDAEVKLAGFERTISTELINWNGMERTDTVFDISETVSLF